MGELVSSKENESGIESVLESYTLQVDILEDIVRERNHLESLYKEKYSALTTLRKEKKEKFKFIEDLKLTNKQLMHKLNFTSNNFKAVNDYVKTTQEHNLQGSDENHRELEEFSKKTTKIVKDVENLQSQFENETLANQISNVSSELCSTQKQEQQMREYLNKLIKEPKMFDSFWKSPFLKIAVKSFGYSGNVDEINKKISEKEKNVKFLIDEIGKQQELMKTLD